MSVTRRINGATRTLGVIGWPVAHSLSPAIHNAAFASLGLDWVYVPLPVRPGRLAPAVGALRDLGFAGANVTLPHKSEAATLMDRRSEHAERLRAVNTIVVGDDGLSGHNTDAPGFERFVRQDVGFEAADRRILLYGGGGVARACALALGRAGAAEIVVALRDPSHDVAIRRALEGIAVAVRSIPFDDAAGVKADLVVNATPVGLAGDRLPVPRLGPEQVVIDLIYHPPVTPLLAAARDAGAAAFGGLGLLLEQAALSFEIWTGQVAPLEVMSAAGLAALADGADTPA
jgi:shikimate dehydrogenase